MPNIVIEKGGQTYRFGLNKDRSVTNGKAVPVTYNGVDYYARYGTDATPLKIEVNGKTYSVQYDAADFKTVTWQGSSSHTKTVFFPKGKYRIEMSLHQFKQSEVYVNVSGNKTITVEINKLGQYGGSYRLTIQGVYDEVIYNNYNDPSYRIERIGD